MEMLAAPQLHTNPAITVHDLHQWVHYPTQLQILDSTSNYK
jgi:hypothetical protein